METATKTTGVLEDFQYAEQIKELGDQLIAIFSEMQFSASMLIIETNHKIGEMIVNHEAYQKGKHGAGQLISHLAAVTGRSEQHLYLCIQFYMKHRQVSNALETLQTDEKKLTWRHIVSSLSAEKPACPHPVTFEVKFTCCRNCGSKIKKKVNV